MAFKKLLDTLDYLLFIISNFFTILLLSSAFRELFLPSMSRES